MELPGRYEEDAETAEAVDSLAAIARLFIEHDWSLL